jgi:outer membrane protein assembly factor BamB
VLVGDSIYATSEDGTTFIFKASPEGFELLAENTLEVDDLQATPAYCDSKIYMRVAFGTKEERKEMLYCISNTQ